MWEERGNSIFWSNGQVWHITAPWNYATPKYSTTTRLLKKAGHGRAMRRLVVRYLHSKGHKFS